MPSVLANASSSRRRRNGQDAHDSRHGRAFGGDEKTRRCGQHDWSGSDLHQHGRTLHSYLGIGKGQGDLGELLTRIRRNPNANKAWTQSDVLVIDEISMLSPMLFCKLDQIGRRMRSRYDRLSEGFSWFWLVTFFSCLRSCPRRRRRGWIANSVSKLLCGKRLFRLASVFINSCAPFGNPIPSSRVF